MPVAFGWLAFVVFMSIKIMLGMLLQFRKWHFLLRFKRRRKVEGAEAR